jgi:hypothetical protein
MAEVKCESRTQFIGVARYDLYLLADEGSFALNFYKGAVGLWLRLALVVGIAVTCSTYLSGVISWLATMFLFGLGMVQDFIAELASGKSVGGGPLESLVRLARVENITNPLDPTPGTRVALFGDQFFQWGLRRVLNVIPDVDRLDWSDHVAEGFNIYWWSDTAGAPGLLMNALFVAAYLLPWALLAYYLIKTREVAA